MADRDGPPVALDGDGDGGSRPGPPSEHAGRLPSGVGGDAGDVDGAGRDRRRCRPPAAGGAGPDHQPATGPAPRRIVTGLVDEDEGIACRSPEAGALAVEGAGRQRRRVGDDHAVAEIVVRPRRGGRPRVELGRPRPDATDVHMGGRHRDRQLHDQRPSDGRRARPDELDDRTRAEIGHDRGVLDHVGLGEICVGGVGRRTVGPCRRADADVDVEHAERSHNRGINGAHRLHVQTVRIPAVGSGRDTRAASVEQSVMIGLSVKHAFDNAFTM